MSLGPWYLESPLIKASRRRGAIEASSNADKLGSQMLHLIPTWDGRKPRSLVTCKNHTRKSLAIIILPNYRHIVRLAVMLESQTIYAAISARYEASMLVHFGLE